MPENRSQFTLYNALIQAIDNQLSSKEETLAHLAYTTGFTTQQFEQRLANRLSPSLSLLDNALLKNRLLLSFTLEPLLTYPGSLADFLKTADRLGLQEHQDAEGNTVFTNTSGQRVAIVQEGAAKTTVWVVGSLLHYSYY